MLQEYGPDHRKNDCFGNVKEIGFQEEKQVIIKSKHWRKISHILNFGGQVYLKYMISKKPNMEVKQIINIIHTPIQKKTEDQTEFLHKYIVRKHQSLLKNFIDYNKDTIYRFLYHLQTNLLNTGTQIFDYGQESNYIYTILHGHIDVLIPSN